ncbi:hypothetical protein C7212DRAFT_208648 [Tuber magnatum]|uniref:Uncharacterized protein n=1 Tax=Tuber magnatum TaxID=42249 RepID=A0A317SJG5_9PEZI|nr:hypothetical protein C7212DRAFT_208648 [Tuber magnatum]
MSTTATITPAQHDQQRFQRAKEMHQKALADIEEEQARLREMIASKRAEKETLEAVYDRLKKRGEDGKG